MQRMNDQERAKRIARIIEEAAQRAVASPSTQTEEPPQNGFTATKRGGCLSCDPSYCPECGSFFTGKAFVIKHPIKVKRTLSDSEMHYIAWPASCLACSRRPPPTPDRRLGR